MGARLLREVLALLLLGTFSHAARAQYVTTPDGSGGVTITGYSGPGGALTIPGTIVGLTVTGIGDSVFVNNTTLTRVTIPDSVTSIGSGTFVGCINMTSVAFGAGLKTIGIQSFYSCPVLTSVTFPGSMTSIGSYSFGSCATLSSAVFLGNAPAIGTSVFASTAGGFTVYYAYGATGFSIPTWKDSSGDTFSSVNSGAFSGVFLGGGWYYSTWFGTYNSTYYPWVFRTDLGFVYVTTADNTNIYLYVLNGNPGNMGWLYTTPANFPNVYSYSKGAWLWYESGSTYFYNYSTPGWETY